MHCKQWEWKYIVLIFLLRRWLFLFFFGLPCSKWNSILFIACSLICTWHKHNGWQPKFATNSSIWIFFSGQSPRSLKKFSIKCFRKCLIVQMLIRMCLSRVADINKQLQIGIDRFGFIFELIVQQFTKRRQIIATTKTIDQIDFYFIHVRRTYTFNTKHTFPSIAYHNDALVSRAD